MRVIGISDFNLMSLAPELKKLDADLRMVDAPFGQIGQSILDPTSAGWSDEPEVALVWTRPEQAVPAFAPVLAGEAVPVEEVLEGVDAYLGLIGNLQGRVQTVLVPLWILPPERRVYSTHSINDPAGADRLLAEMNRRLQQGLDELGGYYALNTSAWFAKVGASAHSSKLWAMGKIPYSNELFREAAVTIRSTLRGIAGKSRKLIIVDLDDTMWGGIVGDDGMEGLRLGGHDPVGESFVNFQRALQALNRRGIALGICSKNEEATALKAIREHPEMVLREKDFAGWRINWTDKAQNVAELTAEINVGLDSVVFLDDNPAERARVAEALPDVLVPDWPKDPSAYVAALEALDCFNPPSLSSEDRDRGQMYAAERERRATKANVSDLNSWIKTLGTVVTREDFGQANRPRITQLLNKTNQMNLTTRRMTEEELSEWAAADHRQTWGFRVHDKMGDLGLTGIVSVEERDGAAHLVDFILSCRVMGRRVEETLLAQAIQWAQERGLSHLHAAPIATEKNAPCLRFFSESKLETNDDGATYSWPTDREFAFPDGVEFVTAQEA